MSEFVAHNVSFFAGKDGSAVVRKVESGGYTAEEITDLVGDIINSKTAVSHWAVWDARSEAPTARRDKPYSAAEFKKLCSGQDVALVWCRRKTFRAPVIKIGAVDEKPAQGKKTTTRLGR